MHAEGTQSKRQPPVAASLISLALVAIIGATNPAQAQEEAESTSLNPDAAAADVIQDASGAGAIVQLTPEEQLDDSQARFLSFYSDGLYDQALTAARQSFELARDIYGEQSIEVALTLINLASTQFKTGDLTAARANYETSIYLIEEIDGIVAPQLVNPLMGLAATHNATGAYDKGLLAYNRALRINHVDLGLNNIEQMKIRDGLTESYLGLGDDKDANFQQETQARIIKQEYGDDLDAVLPAIYKLAEWYRRSGQPEKEALLMQNTVRLVKQASGDDSAKQIKALREMAAAYQRLDMPAESMRALKRALRISEKSEPADPLLTADILIEIGDFLNGFDDLRDARSYYSNGWQMLAAENATELQDTYFGAPVNIWSIQLPGVYPSNSKTGRLYLENPDLFLSGRLVVEFDINEWGRTDNIRIIESDPSELLDKRVAYLLNRYYYRPRFADGNPVVTQNISVSHQFSYLPSERKGEKESEPGNGTAKKSDDRLEYPDGAN